MHSLFHQKTEPRAVPGIHYTAAISTVRKHEVISDAVKGFNKLNHEPLVGTTESEANVICKNQIACNLKERN